MPGLNPRVVGKLVDRARSVGPEAQNARRVLRRHGYRPPTRSTSSMAMVPTRNVPRQNVSRNLPALGTGRSPVAAARTGKNVSRIVAAGIIGGVGVNAVRSRSGRPADRVVGRPTGMYGY